MRTRAFSVMIFLLLAAMPASSVGQDPGAAKPHLTLGVDGFILAETGKAQRKFGSLEELVDAVPGLRGEFSVKAREDAPAGRGGASRTPARQDLLEGRPGRKGEKIRIEAGQIPVLELARFLADFKGMPVIIDSGDKTFEGTIMVPAAVPAADDALVTRMLEAGHFHLRESKLREGTQVLLIESSGAPAGPVEPESHPVVIVGEEQGGTGRALQGEPGRARRVARGPEGRASSYGGLVLEPIPEMVRAQVDLESGQGLFVDRVDEETKKSHSEFAPLRQYDIITHVNDVRIDSAGDLVVALKKVLPGEYLQYRLIRKGVTKIARARKGG